MKSAAKHLLAGTAIAFAGGTPALAADIYEPTVIEAPEYVPAAVASWYLRGDIGMSNQKLDSGLYNILFEDAAVHEFLDPGEFSSAPTFQVGIGYEFNDWLRSDLTAQYRGKADFAALDRYDETGDGTFDGTDEYTAKKSELLLMANAYVDLGTVKGITPYVGAGVGASRNTISNYRDINVPTGGVAYASTHSEWHFAWALHAGIGYEVNDRLTLDLGYSYLHLGNAQSGDVISYDGTNNEFNPSTFNDIGSHDVRLGFRYKFGS
ncbi:outer membrane protein [Oricola thermophila]|uniref:Porin family protein n=1 Tax=Oricola thermophila TaxID=2742145 RepID=A0A6N1V7Q2_9HYPH|nr:outer membrane beta-barrel protein [Oricola thermophila]QKV16961.1 porin family protein [Oricola thermophila]